MIFTFCVQRRVLLVCVRGLIVRAQYALPSLCMVVRPRYLFTNSYTYLRALLCMLFHQRTRLCCLDVVRTRKRFVSLLAGEQTNSVITYYCAVSVPFRSKQNCMDVSVWLHKQGGLNILLCARFKRLPLSYQGDRVVF